MCTYTSAPKHTASPVTVASWGLQAYLAKPSWLFSAHTSSASATVDTGARPVLRKKEDRIEPPLSLGLGRFAYYFHSGSSFCCTEEPEKFKNNSLLLSTFKKEIVECLIVRRILIILIHCQQKSAFSAEILVLTVRLPLQNIQWFLNWCTELELVYTCVSAPCGTFHVEPVSVII